MQHLGVAVEAASAGPRQSLVEKSVKRAESFHDLEAAPRDADRAATEADAVVSFDQHGSHAMIRQPQRHGKSHRSASDDRHAMMLGFCSATHRWAPGFVALSGEGIRLEFVVHPVLL